MRRRDRQPLVSRRHFLSYFRWAPVLFVPAPFQSIPLHPALSLTPAIPFFADDFSDFHVTPHYPAKSPLDDILRLVTPGSDEFVTEKYAFEIAQLLSQWSRSLKSSFPGLAELAKFLDPAFAASPLIPSEETTLRSHGGIEVRRRRFTSNPTVGQEQFLQSVKLYLAPLADVETAEFQIIGIEEVNHSPLSVDMEVRYEIGGTRNDGSREHRVGVWRMKWSYSETHGWRINRWEATGETISHAKSRIFIDVSSQALGTVASYQQQLLRGVDHWRTVLDGASGIDLYGNNGVAAGDYDNDGWDDLYICQPAGLPNRLYRNRGDGTFEDVTEKSGVGVLDATSCALFADFENKGLQDLLVVCASGPLLFLNQGNGKFSLKRDAFLFSRPPQGTFTHAAIADYDHDGRLDVYFCLYNYYLGLDQYHYPAPYFDARNGPPNFLFHNSGNATFEDHTEAAGLNIENDRYSFACAWGDANGDGWPDLYVANDFGRSNLYRNNGDGKFASISSEAGVEVPGAGMSACWFDSNNDGNQDIYVANMWSAAGLRVSQQKLFQKSAPESLRNLYRRHAQGNSFYQNGGDGKFKNVSDSNGTAIGRWAWSSDSWDFDQDGHSDLYVANGYISGPDSRDVSSFFWRQVVGKSPQDSTPAPLYERGWNALNELIRSDATWNGYERNCLFLNNGDGTFSDVAGVAGMDFPEDARSFALADLDHDGRLEVVLKNRNAPQLRILRNAMEEIGNGIAIRLRGTKSNRDAIGAAVTVETDSLRQTKYLQAGSGFLSQHTKQLFFGLGKFRESVRATVRWPSGAKQTFPSLPINRRIAIEEGSANFIAEKFADPPSGYTRPSEPAKIEPLPQSAETWLIEPLRAPDFSLPDIAGNRQELRSHRGGFVLLQFCSISSPLCQNQLKMLEQHYRKLSSENLRVLAIAVDDSSEADSVKTFAANQRLTFPVLLATQEFVGIYNILYRYLLDRRRDLPVPCAFLLNGEGLIVKLYQGAIDPAQVSADLQSAPRTAADRIRKALPFSGTLYQGDFQRNDFTYGVALFQRGYFEQAAASFLQVIAAKPENAEAHYNLGTLYLRKNASSDARKYLEQAAKLRPDYPEAWNNLGMIAAQEGNAQEAVANFKRSLALRPDYVTALMNLANLYRRQGVLDEANSLLTRALKLEPGNPEANYSMGMLWARQENFERASQYLQAAVDLRPDYADALNNLGVLLVRQQRNSEAEEQFKTCIRVAPDFDQSYLNLARLYALANDKARAREVLQSLLKRQPQHKLAVQTLEMLN